MARKVLMAEVGGGRYTRETKVRLDGWFEGCLGQHKNEGGSAKDRKEWGALVHM